MQLSPRRRVLLALLAVGALGYFYLTWTTQLVVNLSNRYRDGGYEDCSRPWQNWFYPCSTDNAHSGEVDVLRGLVPLAILTVLLVAVSIVLARWALRPIRSMAAAVARLGPTNLGERIRSDGPRHEEVVALGTALDALMDRVAEGYEGQRRFAANASHELRTPLAVQRTLIEVSLAGEPSPDQLDLLARQLLAANERNEALIEGLLVLAETDRGLTSRVPLRLDAIAAAATALQRSTAATAGVTISCTCDPVSVEGEQVLLERLIANLLQNAIKYNHPDGMVKVGVGLDPAISVSNTGPVVPAADVPGLFEPFRRMSGTRIGQGGGSGLGLTIARSITQAHGGTISATAQPDGGLTVEVRLPVTATAVVCAGG
jgi:signal transduction histidine kinase